MDDKVDYYLDFSPSAFEMNGKVITLDSLYPASYRGLIKVFEITLCFIAMLLVALSQGVGDEQAFCLFAAFLGMGFAFSLLIAYILMLNTRVPQGLWFYVEGGIYLICTVLLFVAGVVMAYFCAAYWAERNPSWQMIPSLAAGTLFVCMVVFAVDLALLIRYYKRYTWNPSTDYSPRVLPSEKTVLPR